MLNDLNKIAKDNKNLRLVLMGLTYKENTNDKRNSPAEKIYRTLINKHKNIEIGFGITSKTIASLKKADGLVVGSAICGEISKSLKNSQNPVTNVTNMVSLLKNKIS